jgi:regulator of replication initiation timing
MKIDTVAKALVETKNAIDIVLKIRDIAIKTATIELQENVAELRGKLIYIRESLTDVKEENLLLNQENQNLKNEASKFKKEAPKFELERRGKLYYAKGGEDPICFICSTKESAPIIMKNVSGSKHICPKCKSVSM